jgi:lipopolysaccharide assembly outer membrane protein LptD (OstA)
MKSGGSRLPITLIFFLLLFRGAFYALSAQEEPPPPSPVEAAATANEAAATNEAAAPGVEVNVLTPEQNRIEMDIKTSSLTELAAWCRSLGLSEGGTRDDLARRLRDHFKISITAAIGTDDKRKVITIESARSTEYFKIEVVDEEYARLSGEVKVSLKDGDAVHRIKAWEILFNRTRNILTASGGVEYIKEEGDKIETFRGESITVNIDNWSSIFLGGVSERSLQSDNTTYLFSGTVISRNDEEVTILNKASISNANNEESLWSLNASRVWLLPGSDFAIFNAVLKVGEIPVMYIPFFYYPADEVIFHPVIGFRTREGNFVQTTTYLLGRPRANSSTQSSITKILGNSSDMEKKREGLFLRSTGKKAVDTSTASLKVMVDYYANLGAYFGADLLTPKVGILGSTDVSLGLGLTRSIGRDSGGNYSPFYPSYDGTSDWNSSNLFSMDVPFRYRFKMSSSVSGKYGSFSWNIPYYSDPWVDRDFLNRAEEMDWVNMIQKGAAVEAEETSETQMGVYSWQFTGQLNPKFPNMSPYISGISISGISSTISFKTRDNRNKYLSTDIKRYSPNSAFFFPDTATLYSISGSISGTPLNFGSTASNQAASGSAKTEDQADPLRDIGVPRSPWEAAAPEAEQKKDPADKLKPPVLGQTFNLSRAGTPRFSMDYRFAPTSTSELQFRSAESNWPEYSDIDWSENSSVLSTIGGDASTTFKLDHSAGLYSNTFTFSGNGSWRQYAYLNEEAEAYLDTSGNTDPAKVNEARRSQYSQSFFTTSYGYTGSIRPLYQNSVWSSSSIEYSLKGLAVKSNFIGTGDDPEWEMQYGDWTKEKVDNHQFSANIAAAIMEKTQNVRISADLPPKDSAVSWDATFRVWILDANARMRILFPGEEDKRKLEPFYTTETFRFGNFGNLTHNMTLDTELREFTLITTALNLTAWGLTMQYAATRMQGYEYKPGTGAGTGWVQKTGDPSLQSRDFTLGFNKNFSQKDLWKQRLNYSVGINSSLNLDLQRYTSSKFSLSLSFTLGISKFLDMSLSATSENAMIYWYFKDLPMFDDLPPELRSGEYNLFTDLVDSFRFDNDELRRKSGFKMKSFRISATHHLGDWNAVLGITMSPYRPANSPKYEINNEVSFLIQWVPISEIKSDIAYNKRNEPNPWTVK